MLALELLEVCCVIEVGRVGVIAHVVVQVILTLEHLRDVVFGIVV